MTRFAPAGTVARVGAWLLVLGVGVLVAGRLPPLVAADSPLVAADNPLVSLGESDLSSGPARAASGSAVPLQAASAAPSLFFPYLVRQPSIVGAPVWAGQSAASEHNSEVALLRTAFRLEESDAGPVRLSVFADTRYEAYVDGRFVGRGPARFDAFGYEVDVFVVPLGPGPHHLAIVAQWAPNRRRSVSAHPVVLAELRTAAGGIAASTGEHWEARVAAEWLGSVQVHEEGLIGPTELLDTTALSRDWTVPDGSGPAWPRAIVVAPPAGTLSLRSAPAPQTATVEPRVLGTGKLSPGRVMRSGTDSGELTALAAGTLRLESLETNANDILLDGTPLAWHPQADRLGVVWAERAIEQGAHILRLRASDSVALSGVVGLEPEVWGGSDAGARLLLADFAPGAGVTVRRVQEVDSAPLQSATSAKTHSLAVSFTEPGYVMLDLGRTVHGRARAIARAEANGGATLDIGWSERLLDGQRPLPHPGKLHPGWSQADAWKVGDQPTAISTLDARAGRYLVIAAWAPLELTGLMVEEEAYLLEPIGGFESDDAALNQIWQIGADSVRANMTDAYADPWRERGQWWGDAYVGIHTNRAVYGDTHLWRRGLRLMANAHRDGRPPAMAPNHLPETMLLDYGLLWLLSLAEYVELTGDVALAAETAPVVADALRFYESHRAETGLISLGAGSWHTKALIDWAGQFDRQGEITALNALYAGALDASAALAGAIGDSAAATHRRNAALAVRAAVHTRLYAPSLGRYHTALIDGVTLPPWPHAQAWSLVYDVPPPAQINSVADALLDVTARHPSAANVEIYGMFWVLEALARADRLAEATELIRNRYGPLAAAGFATWPEVFDPLPHWAWSHSHGWGSSPTWFLTTYVLGARQTGPDTWVIAPAFEGVLQASGALPLTQHELPHRLVPASAPPAHPPARLLTLGWQGARCGPRLLTYDAALGSAGEVFLADAVDARVTIDGELAWEGRRPLLPGVRSEGEAVVVPGTAGEHSVTVEAPPCPATP